MNDRVADKELLQRIGAQDKSAMKQFYERFHKPLFGFLRARGVDDATASDLVQETMLDVWRKAANFRGDSSAKTWVFTIARNKFVDRTRKNTRLSFVDEVPDSIDESPDPEAVAVSLSEANRLRRCMDRLKEAHLNVMRLAFFEDLTYDQIAEVEGVPSGTIKTRIFHAKKLLLKCLGTR